ncbi:hypothetical protein UFOVP1384_44 [uncultured Caudovirales phage]|uniref:Uncharacterized protein n=1 Tax=uncultured Caudovirales phage TaxID=2100421 RepID=A0A6J5S6V0_9CAUD|nr:hypothetical protein UFOVP1384_44 [uncultured Caudovirales phage]
MIKTAKNVTPKEWLLRDEQPVYPIATFSVNSGSINKGREQIYNVQFFFLDKSGKEAEFEPDVISDQMQTASDIINLMRGGRNNYTIDDNISFNAISDKYEDYLAGIELTINISTQNEFTGCNVPLL